MFKFFAKKDRGFTLVELIVVTGIMGVIMLLVVFNSRRLNDDLSLKTAATEVSFAFRQAQNFGISVKESSVGSASFNAPYGTVFDLSNPTTILIYADTDNDRVYDGALTCSGTDECREKIILRGGVVVNRFCGTDSSNNFSCFNPSIRYFVFTYVRPNPEPIINSVNQGNVATGGPWKKAYIELINRKGTLMYIVTDSVSGQVTIQNTMP